MEPIDSLRKFSKRSGWLSLGFAAAWVLGIFLEVDTTVLAIGAWGSLILSWQAETRADAWLSIYIHRPDLVPSHHLTSQPDTTEDQP